MTTSTPLNVFVSDDDEPIRQAVAETLRIEGHRVVEARDGAELLVLLRDTIGREPLSPTSS
jgi:CheY-like chemotaxis protein